MSEKEEGEEGKRQRMKRSGKEEIGDEERLVDGRGDVREDVRRWREQIWKRREDKRLLDEDAREVVMKEGRRDEEQR